MQQHFRLPLRSATLGNLLPTLLGLLVAGYLCLWNLGTPSVKQSDEALHLRVLQGMLYHGHMLPPQYENWPYYGKPPLKMWLSIPVVRVLGESLFSYRLIDGLSGIALMLAALALAQALGASRWHGLAAGLLFFSSHEVLFGPHGFRSAVQDSLMLALSAWAYVLIARALFTTTNSTSKCKARCNLVLAGTLTGLGVLVKTVAALFPLVVLGLFLLGGFFFSDRSRQHSAPQVFRSFVREVVVPGLYAGVPMLLISAAYFVPLFLFFPGAWEGYVMREVVDRLQEGYHNSEQPYLYVTLFAESMFVPCSLLLPLLAWLIWQLCRGKHKSPQPIDTSPMQPGLSAICFLLLAVGVPLLLLQCSSSKLAWYLLPGILPLSLLIALAVCAQLRFCWHELLALRRGAGLASSARTYIALALLALLVPGLTLFTQRLARRALQIAQLETRSPLDRGLRALHSEPALAQQLFMHGEVLGSWGSLDSRAEKVLWYMHAPDLDPKGAEQRETEALNKLEQKQPLALLLTQDALTRMLSQHLPTAYLELPRYAGRRKPALIAIFNQRVNSAEFTSWRQALAFRAKTIPARDRETPVSEAGGTQALYGLSARVGNPTQLDEMRVERAAVILPGDNVLRSLGARLILQVSLRATAAWPLRVLFNGQEVFAGTLPPSTLKRVQMQIPAELWQPKNNLLMFHLPGWSQEGRRDKARALWLQRVNLEPLAPANTQG